MTNAGAGAQPVNLAIDMAIADSLPALVRAALDAAWFQWCAADWRAVCARHPPELVVDFIRKADAARALELPLAS